MKRIIKIGMDVYTLHFMCFEPSIDGNATVHQISDVKSEV